ncbi:rod shape-determining protein MreC [Clostridiaceae bacterium M8S5]|nr:rod shape-determining protein MreC [Clostridiaceae bacterium M8S5]
MKIFRKYKNRMIVASVTIILLIIIIITSGNKYQGTSFKGFIGKIVTPIQGFLYNTSKSVTNTFSSIANFSQTKQENQRLKKEIAKLEEENRIMNDLISRMDALKNEYELKKQEKFRCVDARVVNKDSGNWFNRFVINKGTNDGLKKGDAVICAVKLDGDIVKAGLVGRIVEVQSTWSKVLTIIDKGSNASFKVIRTQDNGIVSGELKQKLDGILFDYKSDVVKGDKLVTSGMGKIYIPDLYIGEIVEIHKDNDDLIKKIEVISPIDFKNINNVMVVTSKAPRGQ